MLFGLRSCANAAGSISKIPNWNAVEHLAIGYKRRKKLMPDNVDGHRLRIDAPAGFLATFFSIQQDSAGSSRGGWAPAEANQRAARCCYATADNVQLLNAFSLTNPSFLPRTGSPIVTVAPATAPSAPASFTDSKLSDPFFTQVNYVGAFADPNAAGATNWLATWTNFDPQNTDY